MSNKEPIRLQRLRRKGFNLHEASLRINGRECVIVDRTNKFWGNPYVVGKHGTVEECLEGYRHYLKEAQKVNPELFVEKIAELRGKNLACWCAPYMPCHVDILLEVANSSSHCPHAEYSISGFCDDCGNWATH